jgi:hypothetical protein
MVRGCASIFCGALCLRAGAGSRPGGRASFLCIAKEKKPKERRPCFPRPSASLRATCVEALAGCAVELAARLRRSAQTATASQFTKHARISAHATPQVLRPRRIQKGWGSPTARTSTRAIAALGPARAAQGACARASGAERSDGPYGCLIRNPLLCVPRSADQAVAGVPQDTPASFTGSPRLSERSAQRAVSSAVHRLVEHRRLPRRPGAGVAHSRVAFSLVTFSWRSKRKLLRRRAHTPAPALSTSMPRTRCTLHAARCTLHAARCIQMLLNK